MSIEVQNITKKYGEQRALNDVSFSLKSGEIVGFLGPNGAGKSTMMKILTCYIPQTEGIAKVCGLDVTEDSIEIRKKVGYLPEHNPLYLDMYVKEYLAFMAGIHKTSKTAIPDIIEKVGLTKESHKKLGQLSKGYRQRAGLAAALLHDPEVLILDEPTTGLDPNQLAEIRGLIKEVGASKTVMLSTHIMQEVEILCDRVIIINNGEIVADRPTSDLKNVQGAKTFLVEFDKEFSKSELKKIAGVKDVKHISDNKWEFFALPGQDIRTDVFNFAVSKKAAVLGIQQQEQKLEQVFQELTEKKG
ncbi:gliding motility-associated ABC transporter ATP-binding subunit GldA [Owenweeksia hongkongensis DSM 17368]|uniref:Gliding motility-associated ABC transporter ATP-binding subunit GldA n=1 Tax=Owenweeksia hongkongensis (strain DSM 17368 / CIP 108786 / JCM 12287 / NRRL B-23963 / UST20020801) TaxID=926562 RepID=G8R0S4_OWEHD|nr:gliding motility-associated ABC transporter ATP-binding subunit GldA [Owenweeksia hongkongensis]AEV33801.1 gliding motility-associated ABC transporter ATP-binding subunit GldA [Owenweeksia hongkongensis DSM 17368]